MSHRHLFHIHNKQHLVYASGNFHAICSKDVLKKQRAPFLCIVTADEIVMTCGLVVTCMIYRLQKRYI